MTVKAKCCRSGDALSSRWYMAACSIPGSGSISHFYMLTGSPSHFVLSVCCFFYTGPVLSDHVTFSVRGAVALRLPPGVALLPNKLHGHAHFLFLQFLHSGQWFLHIFVYLISLKDKSCLVLKWHNPLKEWRQSLLLSQSSVIKENKTKKTPKD